MAPVLAWLNANALAVQAAATLVLVIVTVVYVVLTSRIAAATQDQANHIADAARRRRLAVASTLLEEVRRLRGEIPALGLSPPIGVVGVPQMQPWLKPVLWQAAESDAAIVGLFGRLDERLIQLRVDVDHVHSVEASLKEKQQDLAALVEVYGGTPPDGLTAMDLATADVDADEKAWRTAAADALTNFEICHRILNDLAKMLTALLEPEPRSARRPRRPRGSA